MLDFSRLEPGLYPSIPESDYHSAPGVSQSRLKRFAEAPAKAHVQRRDTTPLRFGSLIHTAILEPEELERRCMVTDLKRLNPNDKAFQEAVLKAAGREIVKRADWDEALAIRDAAYRHPIVRDLLGPGLLPEMSFWWIDPETGLLCRGRADGLRPDMRVVVDLKSAADASPEGFAKAVGEYGYALQASMYGDGLPSAGWHTPEAFVFLAVEKEPPYLVGAYEIDPEDIADARIEVRRLLNAYAECERTDTWPGYSDMLTGIRVPAWAKAKWGIAA